MDPEIAVTNPSDRWTWGISAVIWLCSASLALLLALLLSVGLWGNSSQSLGHSLFWLSKWLNSTQQDGQLTLGPVHGSVYQGGNIEWVRWESPGVNIEIHQLALHWSVQHWLQILQKQQLVLPAVAIDILQVRTSQDSSAEPAHPPTDLRLPWFKHLTIPLQVQQLEIDLGWQQLPLGLLQAQYTYTDTDTQPNPSHQLTIDGLEWAQGQYQASLQLQAQAPLALDVQVHGQLPAASVLGVQRPPLAVHVQATGTLATPQASLAVQAKVSSPIPKAKNLQPHLQLNTTVHPWADFPLGSSQLNFQAIDLSQLWPQAPQTALRGTWHGEYISDQHAHRTWQLRGRVENTRAHDPSPRTLPLRHLQGTVHYAESAHTWKIDDLQAEFLHNMQLQLQGTWQAPRLQFTQANWQLPEGHVQAQGSVDGQQRTFEGQFVLQVPGIRASANVQADNGQMQVELQDMARLQHWLQHRLLPVWPALLAPVLSHWPQQMGQGNAHLDAEWQGKWQKDRWPQQWQLHAKLPHWSAPSAETSAAWQLEQTTVHLTGEAKQITLQASGQASVGVQTHGDLQLNAIGNMGATGQGLNSSWQIQHLQGTLRTQQHHLKWTLPAQLAWDLTWSAEQKLTWGPGQAALELQNTLSKHTSGDDNFQLVWDAGHWQQGWLAFSGHLERLRLSQLNRWLASPSAPLGPLPATGLSGDLALQARWQLNLPLGSTPEKATTRVAEAELVISRSDGDLSLLPSEDPTHTPQAIGLEQVLLRWQLHQHTLKTDWLWRSRLAGEVDAHFETQLSPPNSTSGWDWAAQAPLTGSVQAQLPQLGVWASWIPPGWRVQGGVNAEISVTGTRSEPNWQGRLEARDLSIRSLVDGLDFQGGTAQASLHGNTLQLEQFKLQGAGGDAGGSLSGEGELHWQRSNSKGQEGMWEPRLHITLKAQALRLLARADRRLTVSGVLSTQLEQGVLELNGRLQANQASFILPDEDRPQLGSDVVVRGSTPSTKRTPVNTAVPTRIQLELDLGPNFQLRGQGLDSHLTGTVHLETQVGQAPRLTGQIKTEHGQYRAWGQTLTIETGALNFNGPYDNPTLDILALRPLPDQRIGVQLSGTAKAPQLHLYAEPELPETEKLAWLVLGRPASGTGTEAALLQQAALALLSKHGQNPGQGLQRALGLDEISFRGESQKTNGSSHAAALTVGKRLSDQLYLTYSRSVIGITGTVAILYDISRSLTLRAQAGDDNAIELLFTRKYDSRNQRPKKP